MHNHNTILDYLEGLRLSPTNMVSFGSDGCSTMIGRNNGVSTKFRNDNPFLLHNHCLMHRLQLCLKDLNDILIVKKINTLISDVYVHFCRSAKRIGELQIEQKLSGEPLLQVPQLFEIRWLSIFACVKRLRRIYLSLLIHFEGRAKEDSFCFSIYNSLKSFEVIGFIFFLSDVAPFMEKLQNVLESRDATYSCSMDMISSIMAHFEDNCIKEFILGENLHCLVKILSGNDKKLGKHAITFDHKFNNMRTLNPRVYKYITTLRNSVEGRFTKDPVLDAFSVLNLNNMQLLGGSNNFSTSRGSVKLETLISHYGYDITNDTSEHEAKIQSAELRTEYSIYEKILIKKIERSEITKEGDLNAWLAVNASTFPNLFKLTRFGLIIPAHSADCQRAFSVQNMIKTKQRSKLHIETLDWLMRISLNGPELENMKFASAMALFAAKKKRVIFS